MTALDILESASFAAGACINRTNTAVVASVGQALAAAVWGSRQLCDNKSKTEAKSARRSDGSSKYFASTIIQLDRVFN